MALITVVLGSFTVSHGKPSPNGRTFTVSNGRPDVPGFTDGPIVQFFKPGKPTTVTLEETSGTWRKHRARATYELVSMHYTANPGVVVKWQNDIVTWENNRHAWHGISEKKSAEEFIEDIRGSVDIHFRTKSELSRSESGQRRRFSSPSRPARCRRWWLRRGRRSLLSSGTGQGPYIIN